MYKSNNQATLHKNLLGPAPNDCCPGSAFGREREKEKGVWKERERERGSETWAYLGLHVRVWNMADTSVRHVAHVAPVSVPTTSPSSPPMILLFQPPLLLPLTILLVMWPLA